MLMNNGNTTVTIVTSGKVEKLGGSKGIIAMLSIVMNNGYHSNYAWHKL